MRIENRSPKTTQTLVTPALAFELFQNLVNFTDDERDLFLKHFFRSIKNSVANVMKLIAL